MNKLLFCFGWRIIIHIVTRIIIQFCKIFIILILSIFSLQLKTLKIIVFWSNLWTLSQITFITHSFVVVLWRNRWRCHQSWLLPVCWTYCYFPSLITRPQHWFLNSLWVIYGHKVRWWDKINLILHILSPFHSKGLRRTYIDTFLLNLDDFWSLIVFNLFRIFWWFFNPFKMR